MTFDWQDAAALAIVLGASGYLSWLSWRALMRKKAGGCGACPTCPAGNADSSTGEPAGKAIVPLETLVRTARRK